MALLAEHLTTETLSKAAGEETATRVEVKFGEGRTVDLVVFRDRINLYLESSQKPVAVLRFGSPNSGALWLRGDLIGEFRREHDGGFVVVEIEDGFKRPIPIEDTDPVGYLLNRLYSA